jgi:ribosome-binding protein aMBF1 (putative translation factor)
MRTSGLGGPSPDSGSPLERNQGCKEPRLVPDLGDRLADARQRVGLSRTEVGAIVGTSAQAIYRYESGQGCPLPMAMRLGLLLGLDLEDLVES